MVLKGLNTVPAKHIDKQKYKSYLKYRDIYNAKSSATDKIQRVNISKALIERGSGLPVPAAAATTFLSPPLLTKTNKCSVSYKKCSSSYLSQLHANL